MRERAAAVGGELSTGEAAGGGFLVERHPAREGGAGMSSPAPAVRIVVADDHQVVRTGFAELLGTQPDFAVLGTACDGAEAVRICRELQPDVVLMDVRMPRHGRHRGHQAAVGQVARPSAEDAAGPGRRSPPGRPRCSS